MLAPAALRLRVRDLPHRHHDCPSGAQPRVSDGPAPLICGILLSDRRPHLQCDAIALAASPYGPQQRRAHRVKLRNDASHAEPHRAARTRSDPGHAPGSDGVARTDLAGRWLEQKVRIGGSQLGPHEDDFVPAHLDRVPLGDAPVEGQRLVLLGHVVGDRG